jgi:predicted  nucleic acid-binding Zn-ribbon protein
MYIKLLWELEQKERLTQRKEQRVKEIEEELKIEDEIKLVKDEIAELTSSSESFIKRKKEIEAEIEDHETSLKAIIDSIENGKSKTAKDLKRLRKEQDNLTNKIDDLKRNLGFVLQNIEEKKERINNLNSKITESEKQIEKVRAEYKKLEREIQEESSKYIKEFEEKTNIIPFDILYRYNETKKDFPHGAIALVELGCCSNCGAEIPLEIIEDFRDGHSDNIIRCEVCGKILFYPENLKAKS